MYYHIFTHIHWDHCPCTLGNVNARQLTLSYYCLDTTCSYYVWRSLFRIFREIVKCTCALYPSITHTHTHIHTCSRILNQPSPMSIVASSSSSPLNNPGKWHSLDLVTSHGIMYLSQGLPGTQPSWCMSIMEGNCLIVIWVIRPWCTGDRRTGTY